MLEECTVNFQSQHSTTCQKELKTREDQWREKVLDIHTHTTSIMFMIMITTMTNKIIVLWNFISNWLNIYGNYEHTARDLWERTVSNVIIDIIILNQAAQILMIQNLNSNQHVESF